MLLQSRDRYCLSFSYKLGFECTNNMAKYEALILGMKVAITLRIKDLDIYGDLQIIINQVHDIFDTKDENLRP